MDLHLPSVLQLEQDSAAGQAYRQVEVRAQPVVHGDPRRLDGGRIPADRRKQTVS